MARQITDAGQGRQHAACREQWVTQKDFDILDRGIV
jgi:hypothetical protein